MPIYSTLTFKGFTMEIFKVASQQIQNQTIAQDSQSVRTRPVEQTQIEANATQRNHELSKTQNAQDGADKKTLNEKVKEAVEQLNKNMVELNTNIRFGYDDKVNTMYVSVLEADSGNVIRQFPSEKVLRMREFFKEAIGMLFDESK